jgi:hypothetical protein
MVTFTATGDKRTLIGLGLTRAHVTRLMSGQPITSPLEDVGIRGCTLFLFYGESDESIQADLRSQGVTITPTAAPHYQPA